MCFYDICLAQCSIKSSLHSKNVCDFEMMTRHTFKYRTLRENIHNRPISVPLCIDLFCIAELNFSHCSVVFSTFRIGLQKMPSIRETLREIGVSLDQVLTELAQKSTDDTNKRTVPTLLTNYLDVSRCFVSFKQHYIRSQINSKEDESRGSLIGF